MKILTATSCMVMALSLTTPSMAYKRPKHHPKHLPRVDTRVFIPTKEAQIQQNLWEEKFGLKPIENDSELLALVRTGALVQIVSSSSIVIDPKLPLKRRYCRPWTLALIQSIAQQYETAFREPLVITSAVRTVKVQRSLLHWNRNAAAIHGEMASSHLTGATVDVARRDMTAEQTRFMEQLLLEYALQNRVIVLEENGQECFHIFVIPTQEPIL